jgi:RHS repeat-associated protein
MVYDVFGQLVADYKNGSLERENIYRGGQVLAVYEAASSCYKSIDQFIKDFYQGALGRQPNSSELDYWTTRLTQAQARGGRALIGAAQDLGNTLFTSTEYTNLNTTDTQFVTDLYEAFLQRTPDTSGLNNWVSVTPTNGRSNVRLAFAVCPEFAQNVTALCSGTSTSANLKYALTDLQGSARTLMDNTGAIVARHDYLPFGEEIFSGVGLRTTSQKYSITDKVRQRFAMTERDEATGLDHTWFRKYDSFAGRWTTPDPLSGSVADPQRFNHYSYASNDPLNLVDPLGLDPADHESGHSGNPDGPCPPGSPCNVDIYPEPPPVIGGTAGPDVFIPEEPPSDGIPATPGLDTDPPPAGNDALTAEIIRRLTQCVKDIYGVTLTSIQASTPNTLGIFQGSGKDLNRRSGTDNTPIMILTNSSSFSSAQLRDMNNDYARRNTTHPKAGPGELVLGATFGLGMAGMVTVSPYVNYLANNPPADFSSNYSYLRRQIHELGHSLSTITGRGTGERGRQLEDCVYGKPFTF